ncbi:MAG: MBL fold metallo-hydrolase [Chlorobi bacterium]|nr:MBL fold metallo-hydrolase [Chlorobiota bacterium]
MCDSNKIKITVLGSGTSSGVPTIGCDCPVCTSDDEHDKRLRSSILVESATTRVLIDTSPDFRQQMLKYNIQNIDAVLFTHSHFDHIGGFDDIRAINYHTHRPLPIYLNETTLENLKRTFYYSFERPDQIGGGVPMVEVNLINDKPFRIGDIDFNPIKLLHGKLDVLGYRINDFAYCIDTNNIPEESYAKLENLEVLIIDALRYTTHPTHFSVDEALFEIEKINPQQSYLTHIAHQIMHRDLDQKLPENINISYDGLQIQV